MYNPRILVAAKIGLAAAMTRHPNTLKHETLGYKKGRSIHFKGRRERKWPEVNFRERNTKRNQFP